MAQKTYTIKSGDTLSKIARDFGVGIGEISGYRSGDPDKIFAGETIKIGKPEENAYVSEVKDQLGAGAEGTKTENAPDDPYSIESLRAKQGDYSKKKEEAFNALKSLETSTYNEEYDNRKLSEKKQRISQIDSDIAAARTARDEAVAKVRGNPNLSAATMTGDIKKLVDAQNAKINGLIGERNSVAGEYNAELGEIDKIVGQKVKDAEREYGFFSESEKSTKDAISEYQKALREELKAEQQQDNFERQLAQALEIAQIRAADGGSSTTYRLITDPVTGDALYWIDPKTMQTYPASPEDTEEDAPQEEAPAAASGETRGTWWNPFSWANYFD